MASYKVIRSGNNLEIYQFEHTSEINEQYLDRFNETKNRYSVLKAQFTKHLFLIEQCEALIEKGVNCDDIKAKIRRENAHMLKEFRELDIYFTELEKARKERRSDEELQKKRRKQTLRDNANNLKRIVRENFGSGAFMVTLTYADKYICTSKDIEKSDRRLKYFFKKLSEYGYGFKYVGVRELQQKRDAIHYHLIMEDEQFYHIYENWGATIKNKRKNEAHKQFENMFMQTFWKYGFVDIRHIDGIDDTGAYIAKYLTKANIEEMQWLENRRLVLRSKGIKKVSPLESGDTIDLLGGKLEYIKILAHQDQLNQSQRKKIFMNSYNNKYTGATVYYDIHFDRLEDSEKKMLQDLFDCV